MDTRKLRAAFTKKKFNESLKLMTSSKLNKFCPRESAKASRNISSSGKAIRKKSIRGLLNPTWRRVFKSRHSLVIIIRDMDGHDIGPEEICLHQLGRCGSNNVKDWKVCGRKVPKSKLVYFSQVIIIYIAVCLCLFNLTTGRGNSNFWSALLSGCIEFLVLNPTNKK